jgi:tetratricopeptide (TPR) repeat protein
VYTDLRQFDEAITHLSYAGEVYRELDDRYEAARTLHALGDTLHTHGQSDQALEAWRKALALYDELHAPQASAVRARLTATTDSA